MDDARSLTQRAGGTLEPTDRGAVLKAQLKAPIAATDPRFELRDPFGEVTYRSNSFDDIVAKADRLGALRIVSIASDGTRATITKEQGRWRRPSAEAARSIQGSESRPTPPVPQERQTNAVPQAPAADLVAERARRTAQLEADLAARYLIRHAPLKIGAVTIGQTEYRHRADESRVAFTESTFKLSTDTSSPAIARSMVDLAEARHWSAIRVSGSDDFRRMVWLEAGLRGMRVVGYEPTQGDRDRLSAETSRQARVDRSTGDGPSATGTGTGKQSVRGGGRKAVLAALEAVLVSKRVPERQRSAVMAAAEQTLARRSSQGETHRIKVYDPAARTERSPAQVPPVPQRARERGSLSR